MRKPSSKPLRSIKVGDTLVFNEDNKKRPLLDPYHLVLSLGWLKFISLLILIFVLLNLIFATCYWLLPGSVANARQSVFLDFFFFSVETLATVGYGAMSPANLAGHIVATIEIFTGMVGVAVMTGLVFARFSKPTARILFSKNVLIRKYEGGRALMFRVANERHNRIVEATATLSVIRLEMNEEGEQFFRIHDLKLVRERTPVFALTWMLIHLIDEHSPLFGLNANHLSKTSIRMTVSIGGHDETMAASVYANHSYESKDVIFDARFTDILSISPEGVRSINLTKFHDIEAVENSNLV